MNDIINQYLLARDKLMPEMRLKQPRFPYSECGKFTKNKQRIQRFMESVDTNFIYRNESDKACFQRDMTSEDFKDLKGRTQSDKILKDKTYKVPKIQNMMDIKEG